jgi:hypothetical protein
MRDYKAGKNQKDDHEHKRIPHNAEPLLSFPHCKRAAIRHAIKIGIPIIKSAYNNIKDDIISYYP